MKKKLMALALVVLMIISAFSLVACKSDGDSVVRINTVGAKAFIDWMSSDYTLHLIADYGKKDYGEQLFYIDEAVQKSTADIPSANADTKTIRLSTTTSVNDSGLLTMLVPVFEAQYGYDVEVASKGTGPAIQSARDGNADMILVHSKAQEETFIAENYGLKLNGYTSPRITFMYNYFIVAGAVADPAKVQGAATVKEAFANIAATGSQFISRGDNSGTHSAELKLWDKDLNITKNGAPKELAWYNHTAKGMGDCLMMANEKQGYVLSDKATYLSFKNATPDKIPNLSLLFESDKDLQNTYSMIAVNPVRFMKK